MCRRIGHAICVRYAISTSGDLAGDFFVTRSSAVHSGDRWFPNSFTFSAFCVPIEDPHYIKHRYASTIAHAVFDKYVSFVNPKVQTRASH